MKHISFIWAIVSASVLFTLGAFAQKDSSGIYKTVADFQQGKLSYAINYKTQTHKINDELLFNESEVKVKHEGVSYTLKKSETYGYRDMKGIDYRFVDNQSYKILNKGEALPLYVFKKAKAEKGATQYVSVYYFSKDIGSAPQLLTKDNLKAAFPDNHKFHDAIDAQFRNDAELPAYDSFHKMYKVNHLLIMNPI
jgi:hypothetical protein